MKMLLLVFIQALLVCALAEREFSSKRDNLKHQYLHLVEMAVTGSLFDEAGSCVMGSAPTGCSKTYEYKADERKGGNDWPVVGHTMVGHTRIENVKTLLSDVIANNIPGDFVELGVWRGGVCIFARCLLNALRQTDRKVHLFDAFGDIPGYGPSTPYLSVSQAQVEHNLEKYHAKEGSVFHKGLFKDSVKPFASEFKGNISVLRVDGNFYDSYQDAMYYLYDKVPVGGYVIFDDVMSHPAVTRFWNDFKKEQQLPEELTQIDFHSAYFKKTKAVLPNFTFFRAPQDANK